MTGNFFRQALIFIGWLFLFNISGFNGYANEVKPTPKVSVCFTPGEDCTAEIVKVIQEAKKKILVQAYSFTSAPIAQALVNAQKRGVQIDVILDKSQKSEKYSAADFLAHADIPTYLDKKHAIAHNKIMIIDDSIVITGSFNFTKAAQQRNAENLLVLRDSALVALYTKNWKEHRAHAEEYLKR